MYDKVKFSMGIDTRNMNISDFGNRLSKATYLVNPESGEFTKLYGSLKNLKITVCPFNISIVGSLAKYYLGDNMQTLSRPETEKAIIKLSDELGLDIKSFSVKLLEFGTNLILSQPVGEYLDLLKDAPRVKRVNINHETLYYTNGGKKHILYNKVSECKQKKIVLPDEYKNKNVLRYELRYTTNLARQLKTPPITGAMLWDEKFYNNLVKQFTDFYQSINKAMRIKTTAIDEIKTVSDAYDIFVSTLINKSNTGDINGFLDDLKKDNIFNDPKYYTRLKQKIISVAEKAKITEDNQLIEELNSEIMKVKSYNLSYLNTDNVSFELDTG